MPASELKYFCVGVCSMVHAGWDMLPASKDRLTFHI
jgi:hypothetical protein